VTIDRTTLPNLEAHARDLARALKSGMPGDCGFVIVLFNHGEGGFMTYLSTGNRQDTIKMMRELCDKMERESS
jgi:hypothetical protein